MMRYEMRYAESGWMVWDTELNTPAVIDGCWQTSLNFNDADDLTDVLNSLDSGRFAKSQNLLWK